MPISSKYVVNCRKCMSTFSPTESSTGAAAAVGFLGVSEVFLPAKRSLMVIPVSGSVRVTTGGAWLVFTMAMVAVGLVFFNRSIAVFA